MKNKYIKNRDYYIKEDLSSLLLYFDFFSQGLSLVARYTDSVIVRKFVDIILRNVIIIAYYTKFYKLYYETVEIDDDAIIIIKRKGTWANTVKLVKTNGKLKIIKKTFDKEKYLKEKKFYETYKDNSSKIKLPRCTFLEGNIIEIEFLHTKFFQRLVIDGTLNRDEAIMHFNKIKNELKLFYKNNNLIHGDLWLTNIYIDDDKYYLIDYTDSHKNSYTYDLYLLIYSLLCSFKDGYVSRKTVDSYTPKRVAVSRYLNLNMKDVIRVEKEYRRFRHKKIPSKF